MTGMYKKGKQTGASHWLHLEKNEHQNKYSNGLPSAE